MRARRHSSTRDEPGHGHNGGSAALRYMIVWLAFLGVAAATTWPLLYHALSRFPAGTDTLSHYWNNWWVWQALRSGRSPYHTDYLFYPHGVSLVYKNLAWLHIIPWLGLRPLVGSVAAYNLVFLAHLALCGLTAFILVEELTGDRRAAFLAGLIYQCWPYRMTQPSHPNLISTWGIPLFVLFLRRAIRRGQIRDGVWCGLSLALVGYTRWQLLIPAAVIGLAYTVLALPWRTRWAMLRAWRALTVAAIATIIALTPPLLLFAYEWKHNPAKLIIAEDERNMQTDVLAYLTPPEAHPLLGRFTASAYERYYARRDSRRAYSPYVGVVALSLAAIGLWTTGRQGMPWAGVAIALVALALGPVLYVNGRAYPSVPTPYALASRLMVIRLIRVPDRFNVSLALPFAALAAHGAKRLLHRTRKPVTLAVALGAMTAFEYLVIPFPLQGTQVSTWYDTLATEDDGTAVLNIPIAPHRSKPYMFAQTIHHHPILQGRVSRFPRGAFSYLETHPWLREMWHRGELPPRQPDVGRQMASLAADGVRYIVVHKNMLGDDNWRRWARYLIAMPIFEDREIAVYSTSPTVGEHMAAIGPGLGVTHVLTPTACANPGQRLGVDVAWEASTSPGVDLVARLMLRSSTKAVSGSPAPLVEGWPTSEWSANAIGWGYYELQIPADADAGTYTLTLSLFHATNGERWGRQLSLGKVHVVTSPCASPTPPGARAVNALFGETIRLLGYKSHRKDRDFVLTLYWRAERRTGRDYKVFVHIFDLNSGIPVAQDDAMPLRWKYPTSLWPAGEVVTDVITIPLTRVPSGTYGLGIGMYDPDTGVRLRVVDGKGREQADGRLTLPEQIRP